MKIKTIKAAVDNLRTTETRGTVVNTEALKLLREMLSVPMVERQDALEAACDLLEKIHYQGETDWRIAEEIGKFLEQKSTLVEFNAEPFGYWLYPKGLPLHGMFQKPDPEIQSASVREAFEITTLYAEQVVPFVSQDEAAQSEITALRGELERYKIANERLGGTIEKFAGVALSNKDDGELLQQRLAYAEHLNSELEKDRDAWRRRSSHRLADCQEIMGALKEIERDTTDADSKELATKTIAEILRRAKSNEQPVAL